ncbi:MAG TPA: RNA polymerase-binding protein DksA [Thiotrichaceae bacterium]|nr:RNA polymerase-binding protein DksA [Thiotrichaceae bacterium]
MTINKENIPPIAKSSGLPVEGIAPYIPSEDEEYMNDDQINHFKNILHKWKTTLIGEVDRTVGHMQSEVKNLSDPSDRATQEEEFTFELRTRDRERMLIRKIEKTLNLANSGDYGYCQACGIEIGLKRLEARPTAEYCIDCKTTQEIKERQIA